MNSRFSTRLCQFFIAFGFLGTIGDARADTQVRLACGLYFVSATEWVGGDDGTIRRPLTESRQLDLIYTEHEAVVEIKGFTVTARVWTREESGTYIFVTTPASQRSLVEISREGDPYQVYQYPRLRVFHPETDDRLDITCEVKAD